VVYRPVFASRDVLSRAKEKSSAESCDHVIHDHLFQLLFPLIRFGKEPVPGGSSSSSAAFSPRGEREREREREGERDNAWQSTFVLLDQLCKEPVPGGVS